jgi:membrane-associated protease RseP (regulator of RpoE activity)
MARKNPLLFAALLAVMITPALRAQSALKGADTVETPEPRYYIGVAVETIPPQWARQLKLEAGQGLNIQRIIQGSPAEAAKLEPGDILISVNNAKLMSQDILNKNIKGQLVDGKWQANPVSLEFIRDGDHLTVTILPALRPEKLLASGPDADISSSAVPKTYAGADGARHEVGPGYLIDTQNSNAQFNESIKSLTLGGQTVILSQESDAAGRMKITVTIGGGKPRVIDPAHLDTLPEDLRNLVQPLLPPPAPAPQDLQQLQEKVKTQEAQIEELTRRLNEITKSQPQK